MRTVPPPLPPHSTPSLPPPDFDPTATHPEYAALRAAVNGRDWPAVHTIITGIDDLEGRLGALWIAGEIEGAEDFFQQTADAQVPDAQVPDANPATAGTLPATLLAARLIDAGWRVRGGKRAKYVSREKFSTFHEYLRRAERLLIEVTAREPDNAPAWSLRLVTTRGLQLGQAEARRRYDRCARHHPHHLGAQKQLLQQLCPKWSGSFEKMFAFARECTAAAPEGTPNPVLIADAHLEYWLEEEHEEDSAYLRRPEVHQELRTAGAKSVLHPSYSGGYSRVSVHSTFAMAFSLAGDRAAAGVHFRALGNLASEAPWYYLGDPAEALRRHRAAALGHPVPGHPAGGGPLGEGPAR